MVICLTFGKICSGCAFRSLWSIIQCYIHLFAHWCEISSNDSSDNVAVSRFKSNFRSEEFGTEMSERIFAMETVCFQFEFPTLKTLALSRSIIKETNKQNESWSFKKIVVYATFQRSWSLFFCLTLPHWLSRFVGTMRPRHIMLLTFPEHHRGVMVPLSAKLSATHKVP